MIPIDHPCRIDFSLYQCFRCIEFAAHMIAVLAAEDIEALRSVVTARDKTCLTQVIRRNQSRLR